MPSNARKCCAHGKFENSAICAKMKNFLLFSSFFAFLLKNSTQHEKIAVAGRQVVWVAGPHHHHIAMHYLGVAVPGSY
jgi:hypothetical protein